MSSRALRKARRELEERQYQEQLDTPEQGSDDEPAKVAPKSSIFALLSEQDEEEGEEEEEEEKDGETIIHQENNSNSASKSKKKKKKKSKTKRNNLKSADKANFTSVPIGQELDEIDRALHDLSMSQGATEDKKTKTNNPSVHRLYQLLAVDTQHLHAENEMRKLFGRAAMEDNQDPQAADPRRRVRGQQRAGLAAALAGRNVPGSRGSATLGLRKNIFIQGKEEWPRATSGGLGMEIVEKRPDGVVEFRFVHNTAYQDVQSQFETCVVSMDPERMIQLLQFNPYHISTLLQVSEIAKQERNPATSGDLLERALFSFGRSVHSTFATCIAEGRARLDFRRPENREFWLASWRYISNLGLRATWQTAFEWAKLLLSLSPEEDPYCICLTIDQLALRGRQPQQLIDLSQDPLFTSWRGLPNIALSLGLAYMQTGEPAIARSVLQDGIQQFPWVVNRICQELDIDPTPPAVWGKQPLDAESKIFQELYVTRGKDLWNTPEATSLLVEVASAVNRSETVDQPLPHRLDERNYTRHILLTDLPSLLSLLHRPLLNQATSASDPLPPSADNIASYTPAAQAIRFAAPQRTTLALAQTRDELEAMVPNIQREFSELEAFFATLVPHFTPEQQRAFSGPESRLPPSEEIEQIANAAGLDARAARLAAQRWIHVQSSVEELEARLLDLARRIHDIENEDRNEGGP